MRQELVLPKLGLTMEGGTLVQWRLPEGGHVDTGAVLYDLETDKAVVEVAAEASGVIVGRVPEGAFYHCGDHLGWIADAVADIAGTKAGEDAEAVAAPPAAPADAEAHAVRRSASAPASSRRRASPYARRLARQRGVSLESLSGTGPKGRIVARDIPEPAQPGTAGRRAEGGHRGATARYTQASAEIPQFSVRRTFEAEWLVGAMRYRGALSVPKVSYSDFFLQGAWLALEAVPALCARYRDGGVTPVTLPGLGLAVATEHGLLSPVLRWERGPGLNRIAEDRAALVERARQGRLLARDLGEATLTLSNLGPFGVDGFTALVEPGAAAILAIGRIRQAPVARDGHLAVAWVVECTLSVDHRVADGVDAARFLETLGAYLGSGSGAVW